MNTPLGMPPDHTSDEVLIRAESKLCCHCTHLIGVRYNIDSWEKWECNAPANVRSRELNLVNGQPITIRIIPLCSTQRGHYAEDHCGPDGKWYECYEKPAFYDKLRGINEDKDAGLIHSKEESLPVKRKKLTSDDLDNL